MKFNHLNVPTHWRNYWSRYPEGHTILEALISWVSQVDSMVDNQNKLNTNVEQFRKEIDAFVSRFDERLQTEVTQTLSDWQNSGFLDVVISDALQWQLDDYIATNEADKLSLNTQVQKIARHISEFGAVGDGVTDDYDAFVAATEYFNEKKSGTLILDNKIYYLDRYRITGGIDGNDIEPIYFENLNGFTIDGNGATIVLKGNIHRKHDYDASGFKYSYIHQLSIYFETCDNINIRNLTIDGEVQKMTRDAGVIEGGGYGLRLNGCRNVLIENATSKRMSMDSIALLPSNKLYNGIRRICRNVTLRNCDFTGSSRQAVTAGHFKNLVIDNCRLNDTGKAGGLYGYTAPGLGVDFEQDYETNTVEEHSSKAHIINTEIKNNRNSISVFNSQWKDISFINCIIENDYVGTLNDINLNGKNVQFLECKINILGNINSGNPSGVETDFSFVDCDIKANRFGMFERNLVTVIVENCRVVGSVYFNVVNKVRSMAKNNYFFMPASMKTNESHEIVWRFKEMRLSRDNTFDTDYIGLGHFANDYNNTDHVLNDLYISEQTRPSYNSPITKVFSKNMTV